MDVFNALLEERADMAASVDPKRIHAVNPHVSEAKRLIKFDAWVRGQLATRIDWTWAGNQRERRIEQCRICLEKMVLELWRRGWLLDGKKLAARIVSVLDAVAAQQKRQTVQDFWAYFQTAVKRFVGANAEELQAEAMRAGSHVGQLLSAYGVKAAPTAPTLPELIAQRAGEVATAKAATLREKLSAARVRVKADDAQARLF